MIQEIKEAARSTGEFTREQYAALDDVIIRMQEEGKINDPTKFLENLKQGAAEAIDILNEYSDLITTETLNKLEDNVATKEQAVKDAEDELRKAPESKEAQAALFEAKRALAEAVSLKDDFEKSLDRQDKLLRRQHKLSVLQMRLERTNNENILDTVKERKNILEKMERLYNAQLEEEYDKQSRLVGISQERLEAYIKMVRTGEKMEDMEWFEELDDEAIEALNGALDTIMGIEKELEDIAKTREEDAKN
jgi:hypothetical protein